MWHKPRLIRGKEVIVVLFIISNLIISLVLIATNKTMAPWFLALISTWATAIWLAGKVEARRQERREWLRIFFRQHPTALNDAVYFDVQVVLRQKHMI